MQDIIKKVRHQTGVMAALVTFVSFIAIIFVVFLSLIVTHIAQPYHDKSVLIYSMGIFVLSALLLPVPAYVIFRSSKKLQIKNIKGTIKYYRHLVNFFRSDAFPDNNPFLEKSFEDLYKSYDSFIEITEKQKEQIRLELEQKSKEIQEAFGRMIANEKDPETKAFLERQAKKYEMHLKNAYHRSLVVFADEEKNQTDSFEQIIDDLIENRRRLVEEFRDAREKKAQEFESEVEKLSDVLRLHYGVEA